MSRTQIITLPGLFVQLVEAGNVDQFPKLFALETERKRQP